MSLILKQKHWRYTWLSAVAILPAFLTFVGALGVKLNNAGFARRLLELFVARGPEVLTVVWLLLPLLSIYYAHKAFRRGTIDRWRPYNRAVKWLAVGWVIAIVIVGIVGKL